MDHFPGWMLESAHSYLKAAELLDAQYLPRVAQVNAAIGMEILLKSFSSIPDQHSGKTDRSQRVDWHDLLTMFHAVPEQIRRSLALNGQEECFEKYRSVFTNSRYPYESNSAKSSDAVLMRMLRWTLANVVGYHKERGSQDAFIVSCISKQQAGPGDA
jgi:hypothetical protein